MTKLILDTADAKITKVVLAVSSAIHHSVPHLPFHSREYEILSNIDSMITEKIEQETNEFKR